MRGRDLLLRCESPDLGSGDHVDRSIRCLAHEANSSLAVRQQLLLGDDAVAVQDETHQFVADRRSHDFTIGSAQPYVVGCTVQDSQGLIYVTVIRPDLISREER